MSVQIRLYLEIAAVIILCAAFALFVHHERVVGEAKIEASDAKALGAAKKQAAAETALNIAKADKADAGADHDQKLIDDYRTAHPVEPVRLCHSTNSSQPIVSKGQAADGSPAGTSPGLAPLPEVLDGDQSVAGPDISPDIDALVRAAGRLDVLYADRQKR